MGTKEGSLLKTYQV